MFKNTDKEYKYYRYQNIYFKVPTFDQYEYLLENNYNCSQLKNICRFYKLKISGNKVKYFKEKSSLDEGWINGGFFVMEPKFLNFIKNDSLAQSFDRKNSN